MCYYKKRFNLLCVNNLLFNHYEKRKEEQSSCLLEKSKDTSTIVYVIQVQLSM